MQKDLGSGHIGTTYLAVLPVWQPAWVAKTHTVKFPLVEPMTDLGFFCNSASFNNMRPTNSVHVVPHGHVNWTPSAPLRFITDMLFLSTDLY